MAKRKYIRTPKDCPLCGCKVRQRSAYTYWDGHRYHPECYAREYLDG